MPSDYRARSTVQRKRPVRKSVCRRALSAADASQRAAGQRLPLSAMPPGAPRTCAFRRADRPKARRGKLPGRECGAGRPWLRAPSPRHHGESLVRMGVTGGRSPGGVLRRREAAAGDAAHENLGDQGGSAPRSAGMQGAIAQWPLARRRHNEIERGLFGWRASVEAVPICARLSSSPSPSIPFSAHPPR